MERRERQISLKPPLGRLRRNLPQCSEEIEASASESEGRWEPRAEHGLDRGCGPRHLVELPPLRHRGDGAAERRADGAEHREHLARGHLLEHRLLEDVGGGVEGGGDDGEEVPEERAGRN